MDVFNFEEKCRSTMALDLDYDECAAQARERSIGYGFLAWLFLETPDGDFVRRLLSEEVAFLAPSAKYDEIASPILAGLEMMRASLAGREGGSAEETCLQLAVQRTRLFRGVAPGYGPPPPYETLYRSEDGVREAELMLQIRGFYREAGVQLAADLRERPDHLGLELDLMRLLCDEEGQLWGQQDRQGAARVRGIQKEFLDQHLLAWAPRFCQAILQEPDAPFYHGVVTLLSAFLKEEAAISGSRS